MRWFIVLMLSMLTLGAKPIIAVSIPMQKEFINKIAHDDFEVVVLVNPGTNPHDFEPKFSDIQKISQAIAYFSIGIEFEDIWLTRFKKQNPKLQIFPNHMMAKSIHEIKEHDSYEPKSSQESSQESGHEHKHEHRHKHDKDHHHSHDEDGDRHVWLSFDYALIIAKNILQALQTLNSQAHYEQGYAQLVQEIKSTKAQIHEIFQDLPPNQAFVVFHPMMGYFAKEFNLTEFSIEVEGKSPKIKEMMKVINLIKKNHLNIIFAQPEFSTKAAEFIAKESGAKLAYFSPLALPWAENLLQFAKTLAKKD